MRDHRPLFQFTIRTVLTALLWQAIAPQPVRAQSGPAEPDQPLSDGLLTAPPLPQPDQPPPNQTQADPPSRVGRVAGVTGTVSFHTQGDTEWTPTGVNYPISTGDAFWTEPASQAQLEISESRIVLADATAFTIAGLDTGGLQAIVAQGAAYFHLRGLPASETWSIQTPRGLVRLNGNGRYHIVVGSTEQPTLITVVDGSAEVEGPDLSLRIRSDETATLDGIEAFQGHVGPAERDAFLTSQLESEQPRVIRPQPVPIPPQVAAMPGGAALTGYGNWAEAPDYGQVWYPTVSPGWVPYRQGHWAYVAPWGWTWIDDAPWGFAPSHYGRWVELGGRWAWTPGARSITEPPVYAPALVTFLGIGAVGAGVAIGAAIASRRVGWVPLGPREPFRPWYHCSDTYVRNVNVRHVTNIGHDVTISHFVNRNAATAIPASAMIASRPLQALAQPITPRDFAAARQLVGQVPFRPTEATAGITPAAARQFNPPPNTAGVAPGPALQAPPAPVQPWHPRPSIGQPPPNQPLPAPSLQVPLPQTQPPRYTAPGLAGPAFIHPGPAAPPPPISRLGIGGIPNRTLLSLPAAPDSRAIATMMPQIMRPPLPESERLHRVDPAMPRAQPPVTGSLSTIPSIPFRPSQPPEIRPLPTINALPRQDPPRTFPPPVAALPQIQHVAPPPAAFRPDPPHFNMPAAMPRLEPPHFVPPAPMQHFAPSPVPFQRPAPPPPPRSDPSHFMLRPDKRPG